MHALRCHQAQAADGLDADGDAVERRAAVAAEALGCRQHRRHHHRAGMDGPALEGVVEILAMRRRAVDERRARGAHRPQMADDRRFADAVEAVEQRPHIIRATCREAEADDIQHQVLGDLPQLRRQVRRRDAGDDVRQLRGD